MRTSKIHGGSAREKLGLIPKLISEAFPLRPEKLRTFTRQATT